MIVIHVRVYLRVRLWDEDEAGAVGLIMQTRLKKVGFDLQFDYSPKYLEWPPGEDD